MLWSTCCRWHMWSEVLCWVHQLGVSFLQPNMQLHRSVTVISIDSIQHAPGLIWGNSIVLQITTRDLSTIGQLNTSISDLGFKRLTCLSRSQTDICIGPHSLITCFACLLAWTLCLQVGAEIMLGDRDQRMTMQRMAAMAAQYRRGTPMQHDQPQLIPRHAPSQGTRHQHNL